MEHPMQLYNEEDDIADVDQVKFRFEVLLLEEHPLEKPEDYFRYRVI
jgi:hypothetical protein